MKKLFFIFCIAFAVAPLFAQDSEDSYYYRKVSIAKIYPYSKGFVVMYNTGLNNAKLETVYIPSSWFSVKEKKGMIVPLGATNTAPNLTVVYKNGEFDYVKLYIKKDRRDSSWGYMPLNTNIDDKFENVTDVQLKY